MAAIAGDFGVKYKRVRPSQVKRDRERSIANRAKDKESADMSCEGIHKLNGYSNEYTIDTVESNIPNSAMSTRSRSCIYEPLTPVISSAGHIESSSLNPMDNYDHDISIHSDSVVANNDRINMVSVNEDFDMHCKETVGDDQKSNLHMGKCDTHDCKPKNQAWGD